MVIFALMSIFLFAVVGLAVDAGLSYFTYNGVERAAAAGALAGVPYMPSGFAGNGTGTADKAVLAATARDGFKNGSTVNGHSVTVTDSRYPSGCVEGGTPACDDNKLSVTVTAWVQTTFLRVLGFGDHKVSVTDTAFYLPPITLGQPGAQLGTDEQDIGNSSGGYYYFLRSEGYGTDRSQGDAFDPDANQETFTNSSNGCDQNESTASYGSSTDAHELSSTNGTDLADATMTGDGFNALPSRGGYNFALVVPSTVSEAYAQVYNPSFSPDGGFNPYSNNTTPSYNMHEQDGSFGDSSGSLSANTYTDQYSAMEYTIFKVNDIFDHTQDVPLAQVIFDPLNVQTSKGAVTSITDDANGQTIPTSSSAYTYVLNNIYHAWVDVGTPPTASTSWTVGSGSSQTTYNIIHVSGGGNDTLANSSLGTAYLTPGHYRLRVDMLDYTGQYRPVDDGSNNAIPCSRAHKGYALRLATATTSNGTTTYSTCSDPNCQAYAIDELAIYTPISSNGSGFDIPVFQLPADYKGTTVDFYVFDPGDLNSGTNTLSLINPDTGAVFQPDTGTVPIYDIGVSRSTTPTNAMLVNNLYSSANPVVQPNADQASVNTITSCSSTCNPGSPSSCTSNCNIFNSHWLLYQLNIPSSYGTHNGASGYWDLDYSVNGVADDTITIVVGYEGAPVHLLG